MPLISQVYCTEADMVRKVGQQPVNDWADNDNDSTIDPDIIDDWINQASQEFEGYARQRYDPNSMAQSQLVNHWVTTLACYYGSQNRGNPAPDALAVQAAEIFRKLELVAAGKYQLPGVALRADLRPTMSNVKIDRRFVQQKVRVQQNISTDAPTTLTQNQAIDVPTTYP